MPWGDRTGPMGMGPMTGRGAGRCAGYPGPGSFNPNPGMGFGGWGRGSGRGRGRGRGFGGGGGFGRRLRAGGFGGWQRGGWGSPPVGGPGPYSVPYDFPFAPAASRGQELDALKDQAKYFEEALGEIRERIGELEKTETEG